MEPKKYKKGWKDPRDMSDEELREMWDKAYGKNVGWWMTLPNWLRMFVYFLIGFSIARFLPEIFNSG